MKTVLITGANKGIGFETAKQLAKLGCFVYLGSRDKQNGLEAVEKLKAQGLPNVDSVQIDVANLTSVKQAKTELEAKVDALDILINNAGIAGKQPQTFSAGDVDNLRTLFDTNLPGYTATDFNQHRGLKTVAEGAKPIVRVATQSDELLTGKFYQDDGELAW